MTEKQFADFTKNGNFTISQDEILRITNDIAEDIHHTYTKKQAAECVVYWSLTAHYEAHKKHLAKLDKLLKFFQKETCMGHELRPQYLEYVKQASQEKDISPTRFIELALASYQMADAKSKSGLRCQWVDRNGKPEPLGGCGGE